MRETSLEGSKPKELRCPDLSRSLKINDVLLDFCLNLADKVEKENLSRVSMLEILRKNFPELSFQVLVQYMQESLKRIDVNGESK